MRVSRCDGGLRPVGCPAGLTFVMAMGPRLDLRQSQSLVMTPQLQQAIKLLAMSTLELENWLAEAVESNPLLEAASDDGRDDGGGDAPPADPGEAEPAADRAQAADVIADQPAAAIAELDRDTAADLFRHDSVSDQIGPGSGEGFDFGQYADSDIGLHQHLLGQAGERLSGAALAIAQMLIGMIDPAGYLRGAPGDVAAALGAELAEVEAVLAVIQQFDPSGVGARNLAECLAIQAQEVDRYDPAMARMIANLDLVARGALPQLRRICGVDDEDLADMIRELRGYDPKPGARFGGDVAQPVIPDIFVRANGAGWAVELNTATLPRLLVNRRYYAELAGSAGRQNRGWLAEQLADANWLVRALDQRQGTILRVATAIVAQQDGFFRHGVAALRPMALRQIAEAIGMHESTVSRVTSNKYLACARGIFELRYFFPSGITAADGSSAVSAATVKDAIARLIAAEGAAILSDDAIAAALARDGHEVARRTVVKYREAMGIGSSVQRRRKRALGG